MRRTKAGGLSRLAEQLSSTVTEWAGGTMAFSIACLVIVIWAVTGPIFGFSDTWQLVINTGTTIVTFLMVFLIQRNQNKDALAIQLKLNELVAAMEGASNRLIDCESLNEDELRLLHEHYAKLVAMSKKEIALTASHSVEEAEERHARKAKRRSK
jgi:low affinity Fe/Cu permease